MNIDIFWLHALLLVGIMSGAWMMHQRTLRIKARFNLYRVRDKFVLLATAEDAVIYEDSPLFVHYYGRINRLLQDDKPLGIDDILQMVFTKFKDGDFEKALSKAKEQARKLSEDPIAKHADVRDAIADYYAALETLILSNSSFLRLCLVISKHVAGAAITKALAPIAPKPLKRGWAAVDYAESEARIFQHA